jgi:dihydroorotate dehydrogenase (fumarate)/dihydropyrimidine dehydrogenase (NAD+) subunit PreA
MADLSIDVAGVHFKNPLSLGSAEPTESFDKMKRAIDQGAGSVVAKSFSSGTEMRRQTDIAKFVFMDYNRRPAHGKDIPKFFSHYCRSGMIQMPEDDWMEELYKTEQYAKTHDSIVIGSVAGCPTIDETVRLAKRMDQEVGLKMLEFDLACPQVDQMVEKGALLKEKEDYFARAKALADNLSVPVIIKLSPQQPDLVVTASGVKDTGAAAVCCHNRTLAFMVDVETAKPICWTFAGVGGPWMLPITLRWVAKIHLAMPDLPIFGSNGVYDWEDMIRFHMSGATVVEFVSVLMVKGYSWIKQTLDDVNSFLDRKGYKTIKETIGIAAKAAYTYEQLYNLPEYNEKSAFDADLCIRCGKCIEVCWYDAITTDDEGLPSSDEEKCKGCYSCLNVCPVPDCITMKTPGKPIGINTYPL